MDYYVKLGADARLLSDADLLGEVEQSGSLLRMSRAVVARMIEETTRNDSGHVERNENGVLYMWFGGSAAHRITGALLTTVQAVKFAAERGVPLSEGGFRVLANRTRTRGLDLRAPVAFWPDRRSTRYDAELLRLVLMDPARRPRAAKRATPLPDPLPAAYPYARWPGGGSEVGQTPLDTIKSRVKETGGDVEDVPLIVGQYLERVAAVLPDGFTLRGDMFYGPFPRRKVDLAAIVQGVDLDAVIAEVPLTARSRFGEVSGSCQTPNW